MKKTVIRSRISIPGKNTIQLHRNTRPELYDTLIIDKLRTYIPLDTLARYPDINRFMTRLSQFVEIDQENIMLSSGIDGSIKTVLETYSTPGSTIALLTPTYKMYEVYAEVYELNLIKIQTKSDLTIDINDIFKTIPHIKILFLPNPHEPVENVFNQDQINEIINFSAAHNVLVVIDEAYFMFGAPTMIGFIPKNKNLLVMRTFSKGFGLPAIRLGYTLGNRDLIAQLSSCRLSYETNSLSMCVAEWAIDNFNLFEEYIQEVVQARSFLKTQLMNKNFQVHGSFSNTILVNLLSPDKALDVYKKLKMADVWIRELTEFPNVCSWVSVGVGRISTASNFLDKFFSLVE